MRPVYLLTLIIFALTLTLGVAATSQAQDAGAKEDIAALPEMTPDELANFKVILRPERFDDTDDKIEVAVVFWYGCGACRETDAATTLFANSQAEDVRMIRFPGLFENRIYRTHGRLFLVLDELGVEASSRQAAFDTAQQINNPNRRGYGLLTQESQETFAVSLGISRMAFNSAYESPAVTGKEARIIAFEENSGIDAVPGMIINGRYVITAFPGTYYQLAEKLINHERARLAKIKAAAEAKASGS